MRENSFNVIRQSIEFPIISGKLLSESPIELVAKSNSSLPIEFESLEPSTCQVEGSKVVLKSPGSCSVIAKQSGGVRWSAAVPISQTFLVFKSPPRGEAGLSVLDGKSFTNSKSVKLNLIWPPFAQEVRISNDGGFAPSKTRTVSLSNFVDWELDDSVKGVFTKVVYVRFDGPGIDTTKTYSDDIILDTTAPVLESSSAVPGSGNINLMLKASDDITGVDKVEIKNGATSVTKDYNAKIVVSEREIGFSVSSASIRKLSASSVQIRVSDRAGNWSGYVTLPLVKATASPSSAAPIAAAPKVTMKKSASARSIAAFAKIKVPSTSKVTLKVVTSSAKFCKVSGAALRGLKAGSCRVIVTVTPKKGKATSKTVSLKVTK
jgi:uncharacterized protein YaiE (UPF0345 family)